MKRSCVLFALVFLCLCLCACGSIGATETAEAAVEPTYSQEELAYNHSMAAYLNTVDPSQITEKKAVVCIQNDDYSECFYTTKYLPEELIADSHEEVRYVIECYEEVRNIGMYTNGAQAYQYFLHANIVDLKSELIIDGLSVWGGEPPKEVSEPGDYYGSRPDFEELGAAITEGVMEKLGEYEKTLCANCGIRLKDQYVCCPECGTFR